MGFPDDGQNHISGKTFAGMQCPQRMRYSDRSTNDHYNTYFNTSAGVNHSGFVRYKDQGAGFAPLDPEKMLNKVGDTMETLFYRNNHGWDGPAGLHYSILASDMVNQWGNGGNNAFDTGHAKSSTQLDNFTFT